MNMTDDKINNFFADFEPEVSDDFAFMKRIDRGLDAVEMIRRHNTRMHRSRRLAVAVAAVAGFLAGFLTSLAMPHISTAVAGFISGLPQVAALAEPSGLHTLAAWIVTGAASVAAALSAYDISMALARQNK